MKTSKAYRLLLILSLALLAAGVIIFLRDRSVQNRAAQNAASVLERLEIPSAANDPYPLYLENPNLAMPIKEVDGEDYIGRLTVPVLGLDLPLLAEAYGDILKLSACRYTGSLYQDNLILCGNPYNCFFGRLKNLRPGDVLSVSDLDGHVFTFQVSDIVIATQDVAESITEEGWALTLFTSEKRNSQRIVIIHCDRIN